MIRLLRNEIYDKEGENAAYDGPTEFTYGADNNIQAIQLRGLDYDDPLYEQVLDEVSLQDMLNTYCALMNSNEDIVMPRKRCRQPCGTSWNHWKIHRRHDL